MDCACENCLHWRERELLGECHRYPPTSVLVFNYMRTVYPKVSGDDLCGEWKGLTDGQV